MSVSQFVALTEKKKKRKKKTGDRISDFARNFPVSGCRALLRGGLFIELARLFLVLVVVVGGGGLVVVQFSSVVCVDGSTVQF